MAWRSLQFQVANDASSDGAEKPWPRIGRRRLCRGGEGIGAAVDQDNAALSGQAVALGFLTPPYGAGIKNG